MASINGFELKNVKTYRGHEGMAFEASLYMNGKRVGYVSDPNNGSLGFDIDFIGNGVAEQNKIANEIAHELEPYAKKYPSNEFMVNAVNNKNAYELICWVIEDLLVLRDDEKDFKKAFKEGKKGILTLKNKQGKYVTYTFGPKATIKQVEEIMAKESKDGSTELKFYASLDQFKIVVG